MDSACNRRLLSRKMSSFMGVDHEERRERIPPPEFGVSDANANCPPDFVMFQNFKDQIAQSISMI